MFRAFDLQLDDNLLEENEFNRYAILGEKYVLHQRILLITF